MKTPSTLHEAILFFSDYQNCHDFMTAVRWPEGVTCPQCGSKKVKYLEKAKLWKCYSKHPKPKFSLKTGTVFEGSPIGLDKWLPVMWMLVNCKNGVSSHEIARSLGVTQKTAWFMLHRGRLALQETGLPLLSGEVEADESFIGGKARNMHADKRREKITGTGVAGKTVVMGLLERKTGKVRTNVVPNRRKPHVQGEVRKHVAPGSAVYTDELMSYEGLASDYEHQVINHAEQYADGVVHTNSLENFWSLLKRGLGGTYVSVEPFHLFRYLDEQSWRYNNRKATDGERFALAMAGTIGKRVMYKELTGQQPD